MGLKSGDLVDLVADIISIDEYESKIDEDAIVVAMFVKFKEPADDLNKFIQKVGKDVIDTDVSPSVTQNGDYVVFVEMFRNDEFVTDLFYLMKYIGELTDTDKWYFTTYKQNHVYELTEDNIEKYVRLTDETTDDIVEFFSNSMIDSILFENNTFSIIKNNKVKNVFEFIKFTNEQPETNSNLTESTLKNISNIENVFQNIDVEENNGNYIFYNGLNYMIVKEL